MGVGAIARVAIWTGINIDWSKRTGRLPRDFRRLARAYARIPEFEVPKAAPNHSPGGALLTGGLSSSDRHSSCYAHAAVKTIGSAPVTDLEARAVGVIEDELDVLIEELRRERDRKPRAVCERPDGNADEVRPDMRNMARRPV